MYFLFFVLVDIILQYYKNQNEISKKKIMVSLKLVNLVHQEKNKKKLDFSSKCLVLKILLLLFNTKTMKMWKCIPVSDNYPKTLLENRRYIIWPNIIITMLIIMCLTTENTILSKYLQRYKLKNHFTLK